MGLFRWLFGSRGGAARLSSEFVADSSPGGLFEVEVRHVFDGDTVSVIHSGRELTVRLADIDCPEDGQDWGDKATAGLLRLIGNRWVYLETTGEFDRYGRILATIFVMDGAELINVNERMVTLGHAWVARAFYGHLSRNRQRQLNRLERWAQSKRVGLWKSENPIPPWEWRQNSKKFGNSRY